MALLYVRTGNNGSDPAVTIKDLGIIIPTGAGWTLLSASDPNEALGSGGQFSSREIRDSQDLYDAISGATLEWSKNGSTEELPADYKADYMLMQDFADDDADFQTLSVSGVDFSAHLDGGASKHDASEIDVEGTLSNSPSSPTDLETVLSELNSAIAGGTNSWGTINGDSGSATADAAGDTFSIVGAGSITTTAANDPEVITIDGSNLLPLDGSRAMTGTLDMSGNSIASGLNITATGDVDLSGATSFTLPQATDVVGTLTGAEGRIAWDTDDDNLYLHDGTSWKTIQETITSGLDHGQLSGLADDDHSQYALLAGSRTRNDITGVFDFGSDGDLLLPVMASGLATLADGNPVANGAVGVVGGVLGVYDSTRGKWLAVGKQVYSSGKKGNANNVYLSNGGDVTHLEAGIRIGTNAVITGLTVECRDAATFTLEVRRNGSATVLASLSVSAATGNADMTLNASVDAGDRLQLYINGTCKAPHAQLHLSELL